MATPHRAEYLELEGLPLATPAWDLTNLWVLWQTAGLRGANDLTPYRRGRRPRRHLEDVKSLPLEMVIEGGFDSDGNRPTIGTERAQLEANINELKVAIRARQNNGNGIITAVLHTPSLDLTGPAQIRSGLTLGPIGPGAVNATFDLELTDGVLADLDNEVDVSEADVAGGGSANLIVPNPGTADQYDATIDLTGTATSVRLTNLTWDPDEDTWLEFGGALEDGGVGTTITTDDFAAVRNGLSVIGLITQSGHERWLPLLADTNNVIRIEPVGGTATVRVRHHPVYA